MQTPKYLENITEQKKKSATAQARILYITHKVYTYIVYF